MSVTIHVNGTSHSLAHKGSMGIAKSTIPDVCKTPTPGGPVPIPYPVIVSMSSDLKKGTKTVKVDGKKMAAIKGSEFSRCTGDEPGTVGGVKSSTNMKEATWLLYSFDVKLDGKNACRLTDKMMMNHGNTACLGGVLQAPVEVQADLERLCEILCTCNSAPASSSSGESDLRQHCVTLALQALDNPPQYNQSRMKPEISYDMTQSPPSPLMSRSGNGLAPSAHWQTRARQIPGYQSGTGMVRRPDVVIVRNPSLPPTQGNLAAVVEMKFPGDPRNPNQIKAYEKIAGGDPDRVVELDVNECRCNNSEPEPEPEGNFLDVLLLIVGIALILTPVPGDEVVVGGAAAARLGLAF